MDSDMKTTPETRPLKIIVVGAGIGGLSAAIFLRQQGHHVTLLEQSRFANELGAAVHVAPNATGLLLRMGVDLKEMGAVSCKTMTQSLFNMTPMFEVPYWRSAGRWQHVWYLAHRVDLHSELKNRATAEDGKGAPATLRTSCRVASVTTDGIVILESGEELQGDVVIGADGVHSKARPCLPGSQDIVPFGSGKSAFRFTIPKSRALEDPVTKPIVEKEGNMTIFMAKDRRVVIYPTRNEDVLNFVCIHPTSESEVKGESTDDWQSTGNLDTMLAVYKNWDPAILKLLSFADKDTLKVWELLDMKQLPAWTEGHLALMGDSAHPFTPYQGQGAGQAMEDAASLACVLPLGTPLEEIPERLKLYQECRMDRASRIQEYSRIVGRDMGDGPPLDGNQYANDAFGHDEWHYTTQKLREWAMSRKPAALRRMPIGFGITPGPRQDHRGLARDWTPSTFTTTSIKFKTSRTLLQNLLPSSSFKFAAADSTCFATLSLSTLGNLEWLGGHGYSHLGLYIHGIQYTKKNGDTVVGTYLPVLFEDLADPIISGREELGFPKVYASLNTTREADEWGVAAGWMGNDFLKIRLSGLKETETPTTVQEAKPSGPPGAPPPAKEEGLLFYKYIPATGTLIQGGPNQADAEHVGLVPYREDDKAPRQLEKSFAAQETKIDFDRLDSKKLPTLHHIVERLAEIPIFEVVEAKVVEGKGGSDVRGAQRLD